MKDWFWLKPLLALMIVVSFILMLFTLLKAPVPSDNNDVIMVLLGAMVGIVRDIYSYYYGAAYKEKVNEKTSDVVIAGDNNTAL